jgi:glyoxylase-like metal-dependent hydrolase (beta-lactamase superfamily II)
MNSRFTRLAIIVVVSLTLLWLVKYILFDHSPVPETTDYSLNIAEARVLARRQPGALPLRLNGMLIGESSFPSSAAIAGDGLFTERPLVFTSFQVAYPDSTIIVDTAHDRAAHTANFSEQGFNDANYEKMQAAMAEARLIVVTHEHLDHIGGIAKSPSLAQIAPRTLLTRSQIQGPTIGLAGFPEGALQQFADFDYDQMHSPAPGLVLIKAPGHSTGSQLVYLTLADGTEYLFVGDIVWHMDAIRRLTGRPRLVSLAFLGEDRAAVAAQIRSLHDLAALHQSEAEGLHFIVAHDADQWRDYTASGLIHVGFE